MNEVDVANAYKLSHGQLPTFAELGVEMEVLVDSGENRAHIAMLLCSNSAAVIRVYSTSCRRIDFLCVWAWGQCCPLCFLFSTSNSVAVSMLIKMTTLVTLGDSLLSPVELNKC